METIERKQEYYLTKDSLYPASYITSKTDKTERKKKEHEAEIAAMTCTASILAGSCAT